MCLCSCLKRLFCGTPAKSKDPLWWTIYGEDGWANVPAEIAEKMKDNLRWVSSGSGGVNADRGGIQRTQRIEYWRVVGCPPSLKCITPLFYTDGKFSAGDPKWYVHDMYYKHPPI